MSGRDTVLDAVASGIIEPRRAPAALATVGGVTSRADWLRLVRWFLLAGGLLSIATGIGFFIAFNWNELGRFGKFALVIAAIVASTATQMLAPEKGPVSESARVVTTLLIGTLLALLGQVYQTGADRWQLFAVWALFALPFAVLCRSFWVWSVWLVVADIAVVLYAASFGFSLLWAWVDEQAVYWALGIFNALFAAGMTLMPRLVHREALQTLLVQIAVITLGTCATLLAINAVIVGKASGFPGFLAWALSMIGIYLQYRVRRVNLVLLSGFALSLIAVAVSLVIRLFSELFDNLGEIQLLLIAMLILGLATYAGRWLYGLQRAAEHPS